MIDLYTANTPNGRKISMALEEMDLAYTVHQVNIREGEQFKPDFVRICPNSKIPAIVDEDAPGEPLAMFESGAILVYLAEKSGKLMPQTPHGRAQVLQWVFWQMANIGPMFGNAGHFNNTADEKIPYAIERFLGESARLLGVLDRQLTENDYLAGDYSIADIASYAWIKAGFEAIRTAKPETVGRGENIERWLTEIGARPATERGIAALET